MSLSFVYEQDLSHKQEKNTLGYVSNPESTRKGTSKGIITFAQWRNVCLYEAYKKIS